MKRILVGSMHHESNTFNPIVTDEKDFIIKYGEESLKFESKNNALRGIVDTLIEKGYEVVPTLSARAVPNGEVSYDLYMRLKKEFIERAIEADKIKKIDGINLALHGSMRVKDFGEAEGDLLEELRKYFKDIPIIVALDMHTSMSNKMYENGDGFVAYKCAPHTDCFETGEHSANILIEALEKNLKLIKAWVKLPILIAGEQSETSTEPMVYFINKCREFEKEEGILGVSMLMGYPWADTSEATVGLYMIGTDEERMQEIGGTFGWEIYEKRKEFKFHTETYMPEEAYEVALDAIKEEKFPIYLSDSGDNPTAGSSSDCTELLEIILNNERTKSISNPVIYGGIYDPEATLQCKGKIGEVLDLNIGAKFDKITTKPLMLRGEVKNYIEKWGTYESDLAVFTVNNVDIILGEKHVGYISPKMYEDLGLEPEKRNIIVCKLGYLTDEHKKIAKRTIMALTKGSTNEDIKNIPYKKINKIVFPLCGIDF
ncbi:M81 family metallopeptidase [Cetobacterium ceti]